MEQELWNLYQLMKDFPEWFWKQVQTEKTLTDKQLAALVAMYHHDGIAWQAAAEVGPGVTEGAIRAQMTVVYQKFGMMPQGPGQFWRLKEILDKKYNNRDGIQALRSKIAPDIHPKSKFDKIDNESILPIDKSHKRRK